MKKIDQLLSDRRNLQIEYTRAMARFEELKANEGGAIYINTAKVFCPDLNIAAESFFTNKYMPLMIAI
jgi:hypothetical protein